MQQKQKAFVVITVKKDSNKDNVLSASEDSIIRKKRSIKITPFDGEGLISQEYASILRKCLGENSKEEKSTSFQIRMPCSKGMLHEVGFKEFIRKEFPENDLEELEIDDYFGIKRNLKDAEIILTDSMFKCNKWLKRVTC